MFFFSIVWAGASLLAMDAAGQTVPDSPSMQVTQIKDQHGAVVMEVSDVNLWRYSQTLKHNVQDFKCAVRNISGEVLPNPWLVAIWHLKDGTTHDFLFGVAVGTTFDKNATYRADPLMVETLYTPETFDSVTFAAAKWWVSPADMRITQEEEAKESAKRRVQWEADEKERKASEEKLARERAIQRAKEWIATCHPVYLKTVDKEIGKLTIRETEQIAYCRERSLYY